MNIEILKNLENGFDGSNDHPIVTCEESWVSGFDPDTKKGFKTCIKTYRYSVLIKFGNNEYMVGNRVKTIFDNGVTLDWHWKETLPAKDKIICLTILNKEIQS